MCVSWVTCSESLVRLKEKVFKKNYLGGLSATFLYKASLVWGLKPCYVAVPIKKVRKKTSLVKSKAMFWGKMHVAKKTLYRWRSIIRREGEAVRPCNFHRKHYFPESPLKASMAKINLHIIIKQFCITVVPLGNDVYSLLNNSIPSKKWKVYS